MSDRHADGDGQAETDGGTLGSADEPVNWYAEGSIFPNAVPRGGKAYVETFTLETAAGTYEFTAEDGLVVVKRSEETDG